LILAWVKDDRRWFEASLGPRAKTAMNALLKRKSWSKMRAEYWKGIASRGVAMGYRFHTTSRWGEPRETLDSNTKNGPLDFDAARPIIATTFQTGSGVSCGDHSVQFFVVLPASRLTPLPFLVDNPDLGDLLRIITDCASRKAPEVSGIVGK
jgi:hypothetical protein